MSFVLQLGTASVEAALEKKSKDQREDHRRTRSPDCPEGDARHRTPSSSSQLAQYLETELLPGSSLSGVKSVSVTYPVAKGIGREGQKSLVPGSSTNTTQVLTTRVISQKVPAGGGQQQATLTLNAGLAHAAINSGSVPTAGPGLTHVYSVQPGCGKQRGPGQGCEGKQLQLQKQTTGPKGIAGTAGSMPNIQRIHVKTQNIVAQGQGVNLQKVKSLTNVSGQPGTGQRNSVPRIQTVKTQVLATAGGQAQFNQAANNGQKNSQQGGSTTTNATSATTASTIQKAQPVNAAVAGGQKTAQLCNNQKSSSSQLLASHPNHKAQHQSFSNSQQQQQALQKVQGQAQKGLAGVSRQQQQQQQSAVVNNVQKSGNSVAGIQKGQILGQSHNQQSAQIQKHVHQAQQPQHQRSQTGGTLQKSQTLANVNSNRVQTITNVGKSNSLPNIPKMQQNSNVLTVGKQQILTQAQQQVHGQTGPQMQQQQLLQQSPQQPSQQQPQQQLSQKQQQQLNPNQPPQRSQSITNVHQKVATIATIPNNQRGQVVNSKIQQQQQQQMVMRVGLPKSQAQGLQQGNVKTVQQKITTGTAKTANSQNPAVQQQQQQATLHRNANSQPVKIIQQQQNVIGPQNTQKQPGCIKTIPPQKSSQRNHAQKVPGIKTSLNTNVATLKGQGATATVATAQKASIKTLLPQQTVGPNVLVHKSQPIKIQQQAIQQKQLIMTSQFPQQVVRQQSGQIKTLLPVPGAETRKEENKSETESRVQKDEEAQPTAPKSPVRRMPLPYECLQFVLQDHNYGAPPPRTPPPPSPPPHPKQQPINGAGSSTATTQHPYIYGQVVSGTNVEDDAASAISSEAGREPEPEGEETETAPEGEGDDEDSITRCICDFEHDDGYMICCDRCLVWQHVDCMGIDRSNIPDEYLCEICRPRRVDRQRARALQMRKREELLNSDTSSDTSSTSSADTDVGVNAVPKKRSLPQQQQQQQPQQQQQQQVPRRKSEPPSQVRRLNNNNNNNNNVAKRQRRDSHPRQSSAVRKKEATKRASGKRKAKRRMSLEDKEEEVQEAWGSTNVAPLRQWIERYEEAVTNHYSPELRARISSIKVNGTHSDLRQSNMNVIATGKCRLNVHSNNLRFLVATMYLPPNTPVVELRGKYMLSTQHRPSHPQGRQHTQRPGPFVFFYRLPRDGTEVCVDTRTYGNDARFVRRSCKPNAEVKHCIEKGTLHLYIVTTTPIEKNAEITIRHEQHDLLLSPNPGCPVAPVVCACNNPRECQIATANQLSRRGSNGALAENADGREKRRRGRRNTVSEDSEPVATVTSTSTSITQPAPAPTPPSTVPSVSTQPKRTVTTTVATATRQTPKEEPAAATTATASQPAQTSPSIIQQPAVQETKKDKKKMTREERKMEAIMKAFERLEKAEQRKQEVQARNAQRKESGGTHSDNEDSHGSSVQAKPKQQSSERPLRRKRRKGRARTTSSSQSQSSRRTRLNSADSDVSSGDESNSMQSPPLVTQNHPNARDAPYSSQLHTSPAKLPENANPTAPGGHQGIPTAAGLLLALANSSAPGPPSSPPLQQPTPVKSPTCDSGASSSSQSSTPSTPLSSACLLVAAAVGPLAPGFKFPKTKKVLMNEWLKESPDTPQTNIPQVSPVPAQPPAAPTLANSVNSVGRPADFSLPASDPSAEFLSQSYAAKSLATLVQAANSVSGICDSPPQRRQVVPGNNTVCPVSTGSAKKRWLRQAISEECDSPNSRPESPPPSEMVAPPKKRRIARESLSSDNYTPPTTPTMLVPEAAPNSRSLCPTEDDYIEQPHSPLTEPNDERSFEPTKQEMLNSDEPMDSDEPSNQQKASAVHSGNFGKREPGDIKMDTTVVVKGEALVLKDEVKVKSEEAQAEDSNHLPLHSDTKACVKEEPAVPVTTKTEEEPVRGPVQAHVKKEPAKKEPVRTTQVVEVGTVEIIDQNEHDIEMEDLSSPIGHMESDAILKQRVAEMRLEFGGAIAEIVSIGSENDRSEEDRKSESGKCCQEARSDDNMSIDEFDVEAQMKKITGDDGNDYKEKVDTSSERDKSMDGIEGLMESSKEDSESEDREMDEIKYCESSFKLFEIGHEERSFKEFASKKGETMMEVETKEEERSDESQKAEQASSTFVPSSEESVFESASSNMDTESLDPPKIFHSIPPLSERIRKKTEASSQSKQSQLNFEAAIIESTIDMEVDESKNGERKSMLSTALRELLEAKLDEEPALQPVNSTDLNNECTGTPLETTKTVTSPERSPVQEPVQRTSVQGTPTEEPQPAKEEDSAPAQPKEIKRLKDPRTVVPNNMPAPSFKPETTAPVKRKLSISEYRKRKQQSSGTPPEPEQSSDASTTDKGTARGRSDSASSGTSSLSSDEEGSKMSLSLDLPGLATLPLFNNAETEEKKGGEEGTIGWSAAPTLVERQRENLTERLKREFGLFLSDDEEERARKHGLTAEAILKSRKMSSPPQQTVAGTPPGYPLPQLPPQPYIPPPGSAPIHYPQFQAKPCPAVQYPTFALPQNPSATAQQPTVYPTGAPAPTTTPPQACSTVVVVAASAKQQTFLVPQASQAPPGSNPYPPQFIPTPSTTPTGPITKFPSVTPPPPPPPPPPPLTPTANQLFQTPGQQAQKPQFFNHPAPRS